MSSFATHDEKLPFMAADAEAALDTAPAPAKTAACRRRRSAHCAVAALLVFVGLLALPALVSRALTGSFRPHMTCAKNNAHVHGSAVVIGMALPAVNERPPVDSIEVPAVAIPSDAAPAATEEEEAAAVATVADAEAAAAPPPPAEAAFSRLLEAVSSETLHDLLHTYMPKTYKHGVYVSEKSALVALHRVNAPLATSIVRLARRDTNTTTPVTSSVPASTSVTPTSSLPTSTDETTTTDATSTTATSTTSTSTSESTASSTSSAPETTTTSAAESSSTAESTPSSSEVKTTNTFTSTINGTPTVVTATSIVGVAASATSSSSGSTASASLQTGGAMTAAGSPKMVLAGVAGLLAAAALLM